MGKNFTTDFRISRKRSGLSNEDLAHLMGIRVSRLSHLQNGSARPTLEEMCMLCLIHGKAPQRLFVLTHRPLIKRVAERLQQMPNAPKRWQRFMQARVQTLQKLSESLAHLSPTEDGA